MKDSTYLTINVVSSGGHLRRRRGRRTPGRDVEDRTVPGATETSVVSIAMVDGWGGSGTKTIVGGSEVCGDTGIGGCGVGNDTGGDGSRDGALSLSVLLVAVPHGVVVECIPLSTGCTPSLMR